MSTSLRRIFLGAIFFGLTAIIAVVGYMLSGWNLLDAIYMVTITIFGVGYGEVQPLETPSLKIFTMLVIVAGCSSGIYVVGGIVQMIAEGEINRALGARRMSRGIEKLAGHTIVCGYGRVGQILARDLAAAGCPFVAVDNNEDRVAAAHSAGFLALLGSAADDQTLREAGIDRARVLATVLPDDAANVFVTLTARELNPTIEIIARAEYPSTEKKLLRSGANKVVMPAAIGATKIANLITRPSAEAMLQESEGRLHLNDELKQIGLEMMEIELPENSPLVGETVGSIESGGTGGFVVVAIKKQAGEFVRNPAPDHVLETGDMFLLLGHSENIPQLTRRATARAAILYRGART